MKILFHDNGFPGRWGKWRLNVVEALSENFDVDFFSTTLAENGALTHVHEVGCMEEVSKYIPIDNYNYYIFDKVLRDYNRFNSEGFDGNLWHGTVQASMLMKKKQKNKCLVEPPSVGWLNEYDLVLHGFYNDYCKFNREFIGFPPDKQAILLYPGGGFTDVRKIRFIHPKTKLICTQRYIYDLVQVAERGHSAIMIAPGPMKGINQKIYQKSKHDKPLKVCFAHLGLSWHKGAQDYYQIIKRFSEKYGPNTVNFCGVSSSADNYNRTQEQSIGWYRPMDAGVFDDFVYAEIDIVFDLQTLAPPAFGWPHGLESVLQGAVLFANDPLDLNKYNGLNLKEGLYRITKVKRTAEDKIAWARLKKKPTYREQKFFLTYEATEEIIDQIYALHVDRDLLVKQSRAIQKQVYEILNNENIYQKLFDFLKE